MADVLVVEKNLEAVSCMIRCMAKIVYYSGASNIEDEQINLFKELLERQINDYDLRKRVGDCFLKVLIDTQGSRQSLNKFRKLRLREEGVRLRVQLRIPMRKPKTWRTSMQSSTLSSTWFASDSR